MVWSTQLVFWREFGDSFSTTVQSTVTLLVYQPLRPLGVAGARV